MILAKQFCSQVVLQVFQLIYQFLLPQGKCQVAAGFFQDATDIIGYPSQPPGNGIGKVHRHKAIIDVFHSLEQFLASGEIILPETVEQVAPELAHRLSKAIEVGGVAYFQFFRLGQCLLLDDGQG